MRILVLLAAIGVFGCGYTEQEMQMYRDRVDQLQRQLDALAPMAYACSDQDAGVGEADATRQ